MADVLIDNQTAPTTPAASKSVIWVDSTTKKLVQTDDGGVHRGILSSNYSTAQQTPGAAEAYITNSGILIPSFGMKIGQFYQWFVNIEKTNAGTTAIVVKIYIGTNQSTGDTVRATLTQTTAQTATASVAGLRVSALVRTVSASGVIIGGFDFGGGSGTTTGWGDGDRVVSSTFDNTSLAGSYVGISITGGTSASYTIDSVAAFMQQL